MNERLMSYVKFWDGFTNGVRINIMRCKNTVLNRYYWWQRRCFVKTSSPKSFLFYRNYARAFRLKQNHDGVYIKSSREHQKVKAAKNNDE